MYGNLLPVTKEDRVCAEVRTSLASHCRRYPGLPACRLVLWQPKHRLRSQGKQPSSQSCVDSAEAGRWWSGSEETNKLTNVNCIDDRYICTGWLPDAGLVYRRYDARNTSKLFSFVFHLPMDMHLIFLVVVGYYPKYTI